MAAAEFPTIRFADIDELRSWMHEHADTAPGVWLVVAKKGAPYTTITRDDLVEVALEFGWIDGLARSIDEHSYLQRLTPRRSRSVWSMRNVRIVERLLEEGRVQPRGLAEIEAAKADGRWERAYEGHAQPQDDLLAALAARPGALAAYEALPKSATFQMYFRINNVKKAETRARKIAEYVERLAAGESPV